MTDTLDAIARAMRKAWEEGKPLTRTELGLDDPPESEERATAHLDSRGCDRLPEDVGD